MKHPRIKYNFQNPEAYRLVQNYKNLSKKVPEKRLTQTELENMQWLEKIGDRLLSCVRKKYKLSSKIESNKFLANIANSLGISTRFCRTGSTNIRQTRITVLGARVEVFFGMVWLEGGWAHAELVVLRSVCPFL